VNAIAIRGGGSALFADVSTATSIGRSLAPVSITNTGDLNVDILTNGGPVTITGAGSITNVTNVRVGSSGQLPLGNILADVSVSTTSGPINLNVDDSSDSGTRTATITTDAQYVRLTGLAPAPATIYSQRANTRNVDVYTGTGAVTVNVLATAGRGLNLHGNSPNTAVFVGNNGNLDGIQNLGISISNRNGDTGVVIDDRNRGGNRTATIDTGTSSDGQYMQVTGLAEATTIYSQLSNRPMDVYTGTGAVRVNVLATCGHGLNLHGNSADTEVFVGNNGRLDGIQSLGITISNPNGGTAVVIDDRNNGRNRTATIDTTTDAQYMQVTSLAPATIYSQLSNRPMDVYTGTGAVRVNVLATCGRSLNLHGNSPNTTVYVGNNGRLDGIQSLGITISNRNGDTRVVIDDRNGGGNRAATIDTITSAGQYMQLTGLAATTTIYTQRNDTQDVNVYTGTGPVTVQVLATFGHGVNLIGNGAGANTLVGTGSANTWNITVNDAGTLSSAAAVASFSGFQNLTGGAADNAFVFRDGQGVSGAITGGNGTNALDYSAYTTNVLVNLQTSTATGIGGGIANIQNVIGGNGGPVGTYNILVGNGGNVLTGGNGRSNLLIAGGSASQLFGGSGGDILIGGTTAYDTEADMASLQAIMAYWTSADDFGTRVNNLTTGNGVPLLDATTAQSNGGGNTLQSGGGLDLIFGSIALDIHNRQDGEVFIEV
jgi:hypothetical protein